MPTLWTACDSYMKASLTDFTAATAASGSGLGPLAQASQVLTKAAGSIVNSSRCRSSVIFTDYASRMSAIGQLSGGQQQRVALGRALVAQARVCLMDEPLSNLDAQLRQDMRRELRDIQRQLGLTVVYVTHDQSEAMSFLGHRSRHRLVDHHCGHTDEQRAPLWLAFLLFQRQFVQSFMRAGIK